MSETAKESILTIQKKLISFGNHAVLLVCLFNVYTVLKVKGTLDVKGNKYVVEQINTMEPPVINKVHMYSFVTREQISFPSNMKGQIPFLLTLHAGFMSQTLPPFLKGYPLSSRGVSSDFGLLIWPSLPYH